MNATTKTKSHQFTVSLDHELNSGLEKILESEPDLSKNIITRKAIREYLNKKLPKVRKKNG
jgi:metal-responsive CopG/Arc/MetJ family transcriptional regulator